MQRMQWMMVFGLGLAGLAHAGEAELAAGERYNKPGFVTAVVADRLWVFEANSKALADYQATNLVPDVSASDISNGPEGMTLKAPTPEVIKAYQDAK